jgi:alpha-ribazole phosphatase
MIVYFMRHGEALHNVKKVVNSDPKNDYPMTERGREQVKKAMEKLEGVKFDVVFCSELLRTQESASIIAKKADCRIKIDKRLNEFDIGFEGRPVSDYEEAVKKSKTSSFLFKKKGFECYKDVKKRVIDFLEVIKEKNYRDVMVVSHEGVVQMALEIVKKMKEGEGIKIKVGNAEYFCFEV